MKLILGIDPGSVITGYGVIRSDGVRDFHVANGSIRIKGDNLPEKLGCVLREVGAVIDEWQPAEVGIEQVFVAKNPMSALKLGQARGAAICAAVARNLPVHEYTPRSIKQAVAGYGAADKSQMQSMISILLSLKDMPGPDAADGLAVALCHAHSRGLGSVAVSTGGGRRRNRRWSSAP